MANLSTAAQVGMLSREDSLYIIQGGKVKRITADKLSEQINQGDEALLRQVAWGIPIKQGIQSDPHWGTCGNWDLYNEYKAKVGRYLVKPDGTAAKLCRTDSSVYADGTPLDETKGNVMVIGPRLYYRVQDDALAGCPVLWMSEQPIGGHWLSNAGEHNCYAAYGSSVENGKLASRSGKLVETTTKLFSTWWGLANANGGDWGLFDYDGWRWFCMLCMCEAEGYMNIQDALGYGLKGNASVNDANVANVATGGTISLGDITGSIPVDGLKPGSCHVNICGFENLYSRAAISIQGIYCSSSAVEEPKTCHIYKGNRVPTSAEFASTPSGEYRTIKTPYWSNALGLIKTIALGEWFDIIIADRGSSTSTYWCDGAMFNTAGQVVQAFSSSGGSSTAYVGPFAQWTYFAASSTVSASRLGYYGPLKFTDGRNI